jgi:peptidoglycan-N-acetylglucosamine deacetylase
MDDRSQREKMRLAAPHGSAWADARTAAGRLAAAFFFVAVVSFGSFAVAAALPTVGASGQSGVAAAAPLPSTREISPSPEPSPSPSLTGPVTTASVASGQWSHSAVEVLFSAPGWDPAQVLTYWRLDGGEWTQGASTVVRAPLDHSNDRLHLVDFYSTDLAGDPGPTGSIEVGIDTQRPRLTWLRLSPNPVGDRRFVQAVFTARDISPSLRISYTVENAWGWRAARRTGFVRDPGRTTLGIALRGAGGRLMPGLYRVTLSATDKAGNRGVSHARVLRVQRPVTPGVWRRVAGAGNRVALTFDDGYSPGAWSSILSTLKRGGVRATFFINGVHVAGNPALARRTVAAGHAIGSHTYSHPILSTLGAAEVRRQVVNDCRIWWRVARASPLPLLRPPYGDYDADVLRTVGQVGYAHVILWDVDPADWQGPSSATIAQRVLAGVRSGSIVLMHVQPSTAAALPAILSGLRARGLQPVTLPQLFRAGGVRV